MDPMPVSNTPQRPNGGTLILDFGKAVPDMSADDLMTDLQAFLDFSKEHSGAVNWIDTLPPQFKQAITDHTALVGMNHDMVLAALGVLSIKCASGTRMGRRPKIGFTERRRRGLLL